MLKKLSMRRANNENRETCPYRPINTDNLILIEQRIEPPGFFIISFKHFCVDIINVK